MPIYWVDKESGLDSRTTTQAQNSGTPWRTVTKLKNNTVSHMTGYIREGDYFNQPFNISSKEAVCIDKWPDGSAAPNLRGDVLINPSSWSVQAGTTYLNTIAHTAVSTVTKNWSTSIDASGRHYGHLVAAASLVAVLATPNSWFFEELENPTIYVNLAGVHPSSHIMTYCPNESQIFGLDFLACTGYSINNINLNLWLSNTGYGGRTSGPSGYIGNCTTNDVSIHALDPVGANVSATIIENCTFMGFRENAANSVIHTTSVVGTGILSKNNTIHCYSLLNVSGVPLNSGLVIDGFYAHTANGAKFADITWSGCKTYHYENPNTSSFTATDPTGSVIDHTDASQFPFKWIKCNSYNSYANYLSNSGSYKQCRFHIPYAGILPGLTNAYTFALNGLCLFDACDIIWKGSTTTNSPNNIFWINGGKFVFLDCTIINNSTDASVQRRFFEAGNAADRVYARRTHFANITDQGGGFPLFRGNADSASGRFDIKDCWYYQFEPNVGYSEVGTAFTSKAGWTSIIDPSGKYDINPNFAMPTGNGSLNTAGSGYLHKLLPLQRNFNGINDNPSDGTIGAWQFGINDVIRYNIFNLDALGNLDCIHVLK